MIRTTLSKLKKAYSSLSLAPRVPRGDSRCSTGKFQKLSMTALRKAEKSTNTEKNKDADCEKCKRLIDMIFGPSKQPDTLTQINKKIPLKHDFLQELEIVQQTKKSLKNREMLEKYPLNSKATADGEDHQKLHGDAKKEPVDNDFIHATTEKQTEEQLTQKIEKITETPMVEAEKPSIEGWEVNAPLRLGSIHKVYNCNACTFNNTENTKTPKKVGANDSSKYTNTSSIEDVQACKEERLKEEVQRIERLLSNELERSDLKLPIYNFSSDRRQKRTRKSGSTSESEYTLDDLAKSCLDAPSNKIDERLLKEMEKISVPETCKGEAGMEGKRIQIDILKKPQKQIEKPEIDLEAREFKRDPPFAYINKQHPALLAANNPKVTEQDEAVLETEQSWNTDPRIKYDPTLPIIDPYDKKTLAYSYKNNNYDSTDRQKQTSGQEPVEYKESVASNQTSPEMLLTDKSINNNIPISSSNIDQFNEKAEYEASESPAVKAKERRLDLEQLNDCGANEAIQALAHAKPDLHPNKHTKEDVNEAITLTFEIDPATVEAIKAAEKPFNYIAEPDPKHKPIPIYSNLPKSPPDTITSYYSLSPNSTCLPNPSITPDHICSPSPSLSPEPTCSPDASLSPDPFLSLKPPFSSSPSLSAEPTLLAVPILPSGPPSTPIPPITPKSNKPSIKAIESKETLPSKRSSTTFPFLSQSIPQTEPPKTRKIEAINSNQNKQIKPVVATPYEQADVTYSEQSKEDVAKTYKKKAKMAKEEISHSVVQPKALANVQDNPVEKSAEGIENNGPSACSSSTYGKPNEELSLSEMLRRVRMRSQNEYCNPKRFKTAIEPATGKCGVKKPPCPPPAPQCPPPTACPPPPRCPPPPPCPRPCKPACPPPCHPPCPPPCKSACPPPPKPACPPPPKPAFPPTLKPVCPPSAPPCPQPCPPPCSKDPCRKFNFPGITFNTIVTVFLQQESDLEKEAGYPVFCDSSSGRSCAVLSKELSVKLQQLAQQILIYPRNIALRLCISSTENITLARGFEPWVPIPSWPIPKKEKKRTLVCPKEGCKVVPPPKLRPPCDENPCINFPKRSS